MITIISQKVKKLVIYNAHLVKSNMNKCKLFNSIKTVLKGIKCFYKRCLKISVHDIDRFYSKHILSGTLKIFLLKNLTDALFFYENSWILVTLVWQDKSNLSPEENVSKHIHFSSEFNKESNAKNRKVVNALVFKL